MDSSNPVRRVVTGHDVDGKSIIFTDDQAPMTVSPGRTSFEVWATRSMGAPMAGEGQVLSSNGPAGSGGTTIRIVDMPAGSLREMHKTETVDYAILLAGELYLILEKGETRLNAGDVVVQRETFHAWHNRSAAVARIAFINMFGQSAEATASLP